MHKSNFVQRGNNLSVFIRRANNLLRIHHRISYTSNFCSQECSCLNDDILSRIYLSRHFTILLHLLHYYLHLIIQILTLHTCAVSHS